MKIVLIGAPGSGKGTQSEYLQQRYRIPHISTGDIFRTAIGNATSLGVLADRYISKGNLVPDEITIELVKERLQSADCENGYILDGFPRTVEQAKALDQFVKLDLILYFNININVAQSRLLSRRVCKKCGTNYNLLTYQKPVCEHCGGELTTRDDDRPEVIMKRFDVFQTQTLPLMQYYKHHDAYREIDANADRQQVRSQVQKIVGEFHD